ncbi:hypothetical protein ACFL54_02660 [Planctomycetota bacterium]
MASLLVQKILAVMCVLLGLAVLGLGIYLAYVNQSQAALASDVAKSEISNAVKKSAAKDPGDRGMPKEYLNIINTPMDYLVKEDILKTSNPQLVNWSFNRPIPVWVRMVVLDKKVWVLNRAENLQKMLDRSGKGYALTWEFSSTVQDKEKQEHDILKGFEIQRRRVDAAGWEGDGFFQFLVDDPNLRFLTDRENIKRTVSYQYRIRTLGSVIAWSDWVEIGTGPVVGSNITFKLTNIASLGGKMQAWLIISRSDGLPVPKKVIRYYAGDEINYRAKTPKQGSRKYKTGYTVLRFGEEKRTRQVPKKYTIYVDGVLEERTKMEEKEYTVKFVVLHDDEADKEITVEMAPK